MTRPAVLAAACALLASGCQGKASPQPSPSSSASAPIASASASVAAPTESASSAPEPQKPMQGSALVQSARIVKLVAEPNGRFVAELEHTPPARAIVTLATKDAPLLPRSRGAYFAIAERIAPGLVAPTALRAMRVDEIAEAADPPTRTKLKKIARVLADGTVEVAITLAPAPGLERIDLADVLEGRPTWKWEYQLASRDQIHALRDPRRGDEADRTSLALYQQLLAADYVAADLNRRFVHRQQKSGRITAAEDNEAYSARARDDTVHDTLDRLSHQVTFSKSLREHLKKLDRETLEKSLRWSDPPTLLVTPKQVEESIERALTIDKLIESRIKQRGEDNVLLLP